jgi:uncharacterized membrane protein
MISSPLALSAVVAAATALAFWLDRRVAWLSRLGASLMAIVFGALLSNLGLVPAESPVYGIVTGPVTSLAIVWLLLSVHVGDLKRAGLPMLGGFGLALLGTAAGAFVGALIFGGAFGDQTWRLAGTFMGTYSGGSLNFVAVGRGLELPETLFAGAAAADNLTTAIWLGACLLLPGRIARWWPEGARAPSAAGRTGGDEGDADGDGGREPGDRGAPADAASGGADGGPDEERHPFFATAPVSTLQLSLLFGMGLVLLIAADLVGRLVPQVPDVLWLTTMALVVGHTRPFARMDGALQLGNFALHLFFVVIGAFSRIGEILEAGLAVFLFTLTVVGVHGLVVFGLGRVAELDPETLAVASQASVGGPSTALAVAASRKWPALLLPGVAVGLLGYAAGNYLGFAVAAAARALGL